MEDQEEEDMTPNALQVAKSDVLSAALQANSTVSDECLTS